VCVPRDHRRPAEQERTYRNHQRGGHGRSTVHNRERSSVPRWLLEKQIASGSPIPNRRCSWPAGQKPECPAKHLPLVGRRGEDIDRRRRDTSTPAEALRATRSFFDGAIQEFGEDATDPVSQRALEQTSSAAGTVYVVDPTGNWRDLGNVMVESIEREGGRAGDALRLSMRDGTPVPTDIITTVVDRLERLVVVSQRHGHEEDRWQTVVLVTNQDNVQA
jgi:hypothetical protein